MMQVVLFVLLGAAVGFLLDPLVALLAVPPLDEEPSAPEEQPLTASLGEAGRARMAALIGEGPLWRRPAFVILTAAAFGLAAARYDGPGQAAVVSAYAAVFIVCAATDLLTFRVPNVITYPAAAGAALVAALIPHGDLGEALIGAGIGGGLMLLIAIISRGGMGLGDVKLAAFAGLALGWQFVLSALLITALAGGVAATYLALRGRHRGHPMPYAPFISGGALIVLLWQGSVFAIL